MRGLRRGSVPLLATVVALLVAFGPMAGAQTDAPAAAAPAPSPSAPTAAAPPATAPIAPKAAEYLSRIGPIASDAGALLAEATKRRDDLVAEQATIVRRITVADTRMDELEADAEAATERFEITRGRLAVMTAAVYRNSGIPVEDQGTDRDSIDTVLDADRTAHLTESVGNAHDRLIEQYLDEKQAAEDAHEAVRKEREYLVTRRAELENQVPEAEKVLTDVTTYSERASRLLDAWESVQLGPDTPIMGMPRLSAEELNAWFRANRSRENTTVPMEEITRYFVEEGEAEGVRGDIAYAQSVLETASFGFPDYGQVRGTDNNFAGIGACDSCPDGYGFPDARIGVRAQIQHLRNFADPFSSTANLANPPVMPKYDQFGLKGKAQTWQALTGKWATSTTYGPKIFSIYFGILEWVTDEMLLPAVNELRPSAQ